MAAVSHTASAPLPPSQHSCSSVSRMREKPAHAAAQEASLQTRRILDEPLDSLGSSINWHAAVQVASGAHDRGEGARLLRFAAGTVTAGVECCCNCGTVAGGA